MCEKPEHTAVCEDFEHECNAEITFLDNFYFIGAFLRASTRKFHHFSTVGIRTLSSGE